MDKDLRVSLSYNYKGPYVVLTKDDVDYYEGKISKAALIKIFEQIYEDTTHNNIFNCVDGSCIFYAYPSEVDLDFVVALSRGEILSSSAEDIHIVENQIVDVDDKLSVQYPAISIDAVSFPTGCWDVYGNKTSEPEVKIDGKEISLSKKVYAQIMIGYTAFRYTYNVLIPEDDDDKPNPFLYVAYARWDYGVEWLEVNSSQSIRCQHGGNSYIIKPYDPPYNPPDVYKDKYDLIDYCTQIKKND
jgi:hypothetical protein